LAFSDQPVSGEIGRALDKAIGRGLDYLGQKQRADGSWVPLWFGNQDDPAEENPVYGTGRVLLAYRDLDRLGEEPAQRGLRWLASNQNADGGWGGPGPDSSGGQEGGVSSVEETAVAVEALASVPSGSQFEPALGHGLAWLTEAVESGRYRQASPIGFYFARLWYYEKLYPLVFTVSALGRALRRAWPDPGP
jgi:squalene-hopene/tetraprenyl-beta-curcumene cyclase